MLPKEVLGKTVSISTEARRLKEGRASFLRQRDKDFSDKAKLYTLLAVVIDQIISRALENQGMSVDDIKRYPPQNSDKFNGIRFKVNGLLYEATDREFEVLRRDVGDDPLDNPQARAFHTLVNFLKIKMLEDSSLGTPESLLANGITTASLAMTETLRLIPKVYAQNYQNKELQLAEAVAIARNSYPLIITLAGMHVLDFHHTTLYLTERNTSYFNPDNFVLFEKNGFTMVTFSSESVDRIMNRQYGSLSTSEKPRIGCPASIDLGEGTAIRKLWERCVDYAEALNPWELTPSP